MFGDSASPCSVAGGVMCPAGTRYGITYDATGAVISNGLFSTGMVPTGDFNATAPALTKAFVPLPNFNGNQYAIQPISAGAINQYLGRFDHHIGQKATPSSYACAQNRAT